MQEAEAVAAGRELGWGSEVLYITRLFLQTAWLIHQLLLALVSVCQMRGLV